MTNATNTAADLAAPPVVVIVPDLLPVSTFYVYNADDKRADALGPLQVDSAHEAIRDARKAWPNVLNLLCVGKDKRGGIHRETDYLLPTKAAALALLRRMPYRTQYRLRVEVNAALPGDPEHYLRGALSGFVKISSDSAARFIDDQFYSGLEQRGAALHINVSVWERRKRWNAKAGDYMPYGTAPHWVYIG